MRTSPRPGFVFISYKREQRPKAASLRDALVKEGFNVWWDEKLQCGQAWAEKLDEALRDAACIIVLWSNSSVASQWVRHEASQAIARQVYAPCRIELVQLDSPYDRIQATDLIGWEDDRAHGGFRNLLGRVDELVPAPVSLPRRIGRWLQANFATVIASGITIIAVLLLSTIYFAQQADRQEKVYDCSASRELRVELALEMYSDDPKSLEDVCLTKADLAGATLEGATFFGATLTKADLREADLTQADLSESDLTKATLTQADFEDATLTQAILTQATLERAFLFGATLTEADLTKADLTNAILERATLEEAIFTKADLSGADLTKANLRGAILEEAILTKAFLSGADLTVANLSRANLKGAIFLEATLLTADLSKATPRGGGPQRGGPHQRHPH